MESYTTEQLMQKYGQQGNQPQDNGAGLTTEQLMNMYGQQSNLQKNTENQNRIVEQNRQSRINEGEPVSTNPNKAEPGILGNIVRGAIKLPLRFLASGVGLLSNKDSEKQIEKGDIFKGTGLGNYLGKVYPIMHGVTDSGEEFSPNKNFGRAALDVLGTGLEGASYFAGVPEAKALTGIGEKAISQLASQGLKSGALVGGSQGLGSGLQSAAKAKDLKSAAGSIIADTALGAGTGGVLGYATPYITKGVTGLLSKAGNKGAGNTLKDAATVNAKDIADKIVLGERSPEQILQKSKEGNYIPGTFTSSEKISLNPYEQNKSQALQDLISTGRFDANAPFTKQAGQLDNVIKDIDRNVTNLVKEKGMEVSPNDFYAKIQSKMRDAQPLFASDVNNQNTYESLINKYLELLGGDNSAFGHFNARKKFDQYMRTEFPGVVQKFANQRGQDVKANAYGDIRSAINELVAEKLPANNPYKDQLMREHYLISLRDQINEEGAKKAFKGGSGPGYSNILSKGKGLLGKTGLGAGTIGAYELGKSLKKD